MREQKEESNVAKAVISDRDGGSVIERGVGECQKRRIYEGVGVQEAKGRTGAHHAYG